MKCEATSVALEAACVGEEGHEGLHSDGLQHWSESKATRPTAVTPRPEPGKRAAKRQTPRKES